MFRSIVALLSLLLVARFTVADVTVNVGGGGLVFSPSTVTAKAGTIVNFVLSGSHSITQSTFAAPCTHSGFNSGRLVTGNTFSINITDDTQPIWFYCNVGTHCGSGMVGAINPPTTGNTFDAFLKAALNLGLSEPQQPDADTVVNQGNGAAAVKATATGSDSITASTSKSTTITPNSSAHSTLTVSPTFAHSSTAVPTGAASAAPSSGSTQTSDATRVISSAGSALFMGLLAVVAAL